MRCEVARGMRDETAGPVKKLEDLIAWQKARRLLDRRGTSPDLGGLHRAPHSGCRRVPRRRAGGDCASSVEDQLERVASMVRSADIAFRDVVSAQLWGETERWRLRREAGYAYRPAPYSGKIDLFRASGRRDALWADHRFHPATGDATWGWSTLSTQPVQVHLVLGDHLSMLREPFVANLAERVTRCLEHAGRTPR